MNSHKLAEILLSKPDFPVAVDIGEDSRDNPLFAYATTVKDAVSDSREEIIVIRADISSPFTLASDVEQDRGFDGE
jgi:hypothetical protein